MQEFIRQYAWFGHAILVLIVLKLYDYLFGINIKDILHVLIHEVMQIANRRWNCASINLAGLIFVSAIGLTLIMAQAEDKISDIVVAHLGESQDNQLTDSITPSTLFWGVIICTLVSAFIVSRRRD